MPNRTELQSTRSYIKVDCEFPIRIEELSILPNLTPLFFFLYSGDRVKWEVADSSGAIKNISENPSDRYRIGLAGVTYR